MRRGIKEMDLILSAYADRNLADMDAAGLDVFDALLHENDQDLYQWVTGQVQPPAQFAEFDRKHRSDLSKIRKYRLNRFFGLSGHRVSETARLNRRVG